MQGQIMQMLMNQLKAKNPQMYQMINQAKQNQNNPIEMFKEITKEYTPEQFESLYKQAEQMGFSNDLINQLKSGINTK